MLRESNAYSYCKERSGWFTFIPGSAGTSFWGPEPPIEAPEVGHVLVIDDDSDGAWLKAGPIKRSGVNVSCVHGPSAATRAIELAKIFSQGDSPPDVIIADFNMPEKQGLDVVRELRQIWPGCLAVCVTATAFGDPDGGGTKNTIFRQQATELGVPIGSLTEYVFKPISMLRDLIMESVLMVSALDSSKKSAVGT